MASHLSERETEILSNFQACVGLDNTEQCITILRNHDWNLESAVLTALASGLNESPAQAPAPAPAPPSTQAGGPAPSQSSSSSSSSSHPPSRGDNADDDLSDSDENAPLLAGNANSQSSSSSSSSSSESKDDASPGLYDWINAIPGGFLVTGSLGLAGRAAVAVLPTAITQPFVQAWDTTPPAQKLRTELETQYGDVLPSFFNGSFRDALNSASQSGRLLFIYLHSPHHDDTHNFCRDTLCTTRVRDFVDQNFVSWAGDIRSSDGYRVALTIPATAFPFCAILAPARRNSFAKAFSHEGKITTERLLNHITVVSQAHRNFVARKMQQEAVRRRDRTLREEQDTAFERSLEVDRQKKAAEEAKENAERERQAAERREQEEAEAAAERERQERLNLLNSLPDEPEPSDSDSVRLVVRFPDGSSLDRRFRSGHRFEVILNWVKSQEMMLDGEKVENYQIVSRFPRQVFSEGGVTLHEVGLRGQARLFVEAV